VYEVSVDDLEDILTVLAPLLPSVDVEVSLRDPHDAPVVASALAGAADAIVTGDRGLLDDDELRSWLLERRIQLLSVSELLERL